MTLPRDEQHRSGRSGWLRAAVFGANDGVVSVASLVVGVAGHVGGASRVRGAVRVTFWRAMAITACVGALFGMAV